jgi:hypothetical protein
MVQALAQQLMYSSAPLETVQRQELIQLLHSRRRGAAAKENAAVLQPDILIEAEKLLTPPQVQALRRVQNQYQLINDAGTMARQLEAARTPPSASVPQKSR